MRPTHLFPDTGHTATTSAGQHLSLAATPIVFVAVGDAPAFSAIAAAIKEMGWRVRPLSTAGALLSEPEPSVPNCLVLDISLPADADLQLQEALVANRAATTVVCITGIPDVRATVRIMKAGAVDVLAKPLQSELLVDAVRQALTRSEANLKESTAARLLRESYASLSQREREVMMLVSSGLMNKQVSGKLGISEITVKAHRGQAMRKMHARTFAELVRMADKLDISAPSGAR